MLRSLSLLLALAVLGWEGSALALGSSGTTTTRGAAPAFQAPLTAPGVVAGDLAPDYLCAVGADGWECRSRDGTALPTNAGSGATYPTTPFGPRALVSAHISYRGNATLPADYMSGPFTVGVIADAGLGATGSTQPWFAGHGDFATKGWGVRRLDAGFTCYRGAAPTTHATSLAPGRWFVGLCRYGGGSVVARANGTQTSGTGDVVPADGELLWFNGSKTGAFFHGGQLAVVPIWKRWLTDDEAARFEASWWGARASDGRPVTDTRAGPAWCDGGYQVGDNAPCVSAAGLESRATVQPQNANGADFSASSWLKSGGTVAPSAGGYTVTFLAPGNIASGTQTASSGEAWTLSCFARNQTGSVSIRPLTTATPGFSACSLSTTSSEWTREACTNTATAAGSAAAVIVASGAATIDLAQCQLEKAATPGRRCDCGATAPCTCLGDQHTVETAGWPVASGWCEFDATPSVCGRERVILSTRSAFSGDGGAGYEVYWAADNKLGLRTLNRAESASFVWGVTAECTSQQTVHGRVEWSGGRGRVYRNGVLDASLGIPMPDRISSAARIGSRFDGYVPLEGSVANLRCGRL
jgi:hypothetical protein